MSDTEQSTTDHKTENDTGPASAVVESYTAAKGDVWKKDGPIGAHEVIRVQFPGREHYDGGLKGVSCRVTRTDGSDAPREVFVPAKDSTHFAKQMQDSGRHLAAV